MSPISTQPRDRILKDHRWLERIPVDLHALAEPSSEFEDLDTEMKYLWSHLQICGRRTPLSMIQSVLFSGDPHDTETIHLIKKYKDLQTQLSAIYANGHFLEITLSRLIAN